MTDNLSKEVGQRIREIRENKGLSVEELGKRIGGKNKSFVSKMERGEKPISLENLGLIASALDVEIEELFGKKKVTSPEEAWSTFIGEMKDRGLTPTEVLERIAQEAIKKDKSDK